MSACCEPISGVCFAIGTALSSLWDGIVALARRIATWVTTWFRTQEQPQGELSAVRLTHAHRGQWHARFYSRVDALERMRRNSEKAGTEHRGPHVATVDEIRASFDAPISATLHFERSESALQRNDAHFYLETERRVITGVLQGYGGNHISRFVSERFRSRFSDIFFDNDERIHAAFEHFAEETQNALIRQVAWYAQGATGVFCFIDKTMDTVSTMTLGNCEATIYRQVEDEIKAFPLSPIRTWDSPKEEQRLRNAGFARRPTPYSRAFGGGNFIHVGNHFVVIPKPKITWQRLSPGDTIVLCTPPLKRHPEEEIIATIAQVGDAPLADRLAQREATVVAVSVA